MSASLEPPRDPSKSPARHRFLRPRIFRWRMHVADARGKGNYITHGARKWVHHACIGKICATRSKSRAFPSITHHQTCMNHLTNSQRTLPQLRTLPLFSAHQVFHYRHPAFHVYRVSVLALYRNHSGSNDQERAFVLICLLPERPASSKCLRGRRHLSPSKLLHLSEDVIETSVGRTLHI